MIAHDSLAAELAEARRQLAQLQVRLDEAEDTLAAIRNGDVDALVVGENVYTLDSASAATNEMRKDVLAQMRDAVLAFDLDDHVIYMNPAAEAQYGRAASTMLGLPRDALFHEEASSVDAARELREAGSYRRRSVHVRADGHRLHVEATVSRLSDAFGHPLGTLAVIRDIDEAVRAESTLAVAAAALQERERQYAMLVENSPDVIARLDGELRHRYVSPIVEKYTGLTPRQHLGRTNVELGMPEVFTGPWQAALRRVLESGEPGMIQFPFTTPGGEVTTFETRLIPEFGEDGRVASILSIAADVTERERVAAELRESKARLEFTLAAAHVGEWEVDLQTGAWRHSALFDRCFGHDEPVTQWDWDRLFEAVPEEDRDGVRRQVDAALAAREPLMLECRVAWPDGSLHWIHLQGNAYEGARYLGIIADITVRKQAEALLREADARKDEFLATLAHELRNPLAPIRNAVQLMHLSKEDAVHAGARQIIERQLRQMVHLVDDLLDVSRISQGKVELRREQADLCAVVATAIETSRPLIDAGHHHLTVTLPPPRSMIVDVDVTRLCQILANLLNNAAKYTPDGGHISVLVERQGDDAVISVCDSGIGLTREMLPRVFDMFAQVDRSRERAQGGLGIGLALVKRLVEMHGGRVTAHSEGTGKGCRFVVTLPLVPAAQRGAPAAAPAPLAIGTAGGMRVLVVDDNVDSATSLSQVLEMLGWPASVAHDGLEAIAAVQALQPGVVVMDIGMPRMSGLDAARAIRALPLDPPPLLVALSGWGQRDDRAHTQAAGFDHHFVKPVDIEALVAILQAHVDEAATAKT